jgi:hypothetical protein
MDDGASLNDRSRFRNPQQPSHRQADVHQRQPATDVLPRRDQYTQSRAG